MLSKSITKLVQYGMETGLVPECEKNYTINLLLDVFHEDEYVEPEESFSDVDLEGKRLMIAFKELSRQMFSI